MIRHATVKTLKLVKGIPDAKVTCAAFEGDPGEHGVSIVVSAIDAASDIPEVVTRIALSVPTAVRVGAALLNATEVGIELQKLVTAFRVAADGDSGDAEHDAACALADAVKRLVGGAS